jgi:hypothetical protein
MNTLSTGANVLVLRSFISSDLKDHAPISRTSFLCKDEEAGR